MHHPHHHQHHHCAVVIIISLVEKEGLITLSCTQTDPFVQIDVNPCQSTSFMQLRIQVAESLENLWVGGNESQNQRLFQGHSHISISNCFLDIATGCAIMMQVKKHFFGLTKQPAIFFNYRIPGHSFSIVTPARKQQKKIPPLCCRHSFCFK